MILDVEVEIPKTLAEELVRDLVGQAVRRTETDLPEGMRLRYETIKGGGTRRGSQDVLPILLFTLNVPLTVASNVAAGLILERLQKARNSRSIKVRIKSPDGSYVDADIHSSNARGKLELIIDKAKAIAQYGCVAKRS